MRPSALVALTIASLTAVVGCQDPAPSGQADADEATAGDTTDDNGSSSSEEGTSSSSDDGSSSSDSSDTGTDSGTDGSDSGTDSSDTGPIGSPGCMGGAGLEEGEHTFMLAGYDRRYVLRLPQNYDPSQPWPLIFALHGNGGTTDYWDEIGGDRDIRTAFASEAIIVIPEAINNAWRDYNAPPETWPAGIELELEYFDTVLAELREALCIDDDNVFSMGFSGGGSFSGVLGCRREYIRAMAVGGSVIYFEADQCVSAPASWITIGDLELTAGREEFRDFFRDLAGCQESSTPGSPDGCIDYEGCGADTPVTFCAHPGDHFWPSIGTDATHSFFAQFYNG